MFEGWVVAELLAAAFACAASWKARPSSREDLGLARLSPLCLTRC